jgi:histidine triad (HIT) family protein
MKRVDLLIITSHFRFDLAYQLLGQAANLGLSVEVGSDIVFARTEVEEQMASDDCIFCKITKGEIPAKKIYEDDEILAFDDINPQAPVHFLVIPKAHIPTLDDLNEEDSKIVGAMILRAAEIAREKGVSGGGYRQVINCREAAGQVVFHLHLHILGGRPMRKMG